MVTRVSTVPLGDYPEGGVLPDPDMMATLAVPIGRAISGTAFVSFPPEQALALIDVWAEGPAHGDQALGCYRRGTRALADAALEVFGLESADGDTLVEDALVATLLATHAPADTSVLTAEIQVELDACVCTGVFVLMADAKALGALAA